MRASALAGIIISTSAPSAVLATRASSASGNKQSTPGPSSQVSTGSTSATAIQSSSTLTDNSALVLRYQVRLAPPDPLALPEQTEPPEQLARQVWQVRPELLEHLALLGHPVRTELMDQPGRPDPRAPLARQV